MSKDTCRVDQNVTLKLAILSSLSKGGFYTVCRHPRTPSPSLIVTRECNDRWGEHSNLRGHAFSLVQQLYSFTNLLSVFFCLFVFLGCICVWEQDDWSPTVIAGREYCQSSARHWRNEAIKYCLLHARTTVIIVETTCSCFHTITMPTSQSCSRMNILYSCVELRACAVCCDTQYNHCHGDAL